MDDENWAPYFGDAGPSCDGYAGSPPVEEDVPFPGMKGLQTPAKHSDGSDPHDGIDHLRPAPPRPSHQPGTGPRQ